MANRDFWVTGLNVRLNVRRLMYQSLIWPSVLSDHSRRLRPALNPEGRQRLTNALIDSVRGDVELGGDFLGIEMLVNE